MKKTIIKKREDKKKLKEQEIKLKNIITIGILTEAIKKVKEKIERV